MLRVALYVFIGWLLHFVALNKFFNYFIGLSDKQYYLCFFIFGGLMAIASIFTNDED